MRVLSDRIVPIPPPDRRSSLAQRTGSGQRHRLIQWFWARQHTVASRGQRRASAQSMRADLAPPTSHKASGGKGGTPSASRKTSDGNGGAPPATRTKAGAKNALPGDRPGRTGGRRKPVQLSFPSRTPQTPPAASART